MGALALHSLGLVLTNSGYEGPLSALWGSGYRSLQYAPLFALGIFVGTNRNRLLASVERPALQALGHFVVKLALAKLVIDGVMAVRHFYGFHDSLWKEGDIASNVGAAVIGVLLLSAYADLCCMTRGRVLQALERVGKRTIYSLCIQVVLLPLAGLLAVQFSSAPIRAAIGIAAWVSVASLVLGWDRIVSFVKRGEESASHLVHDAEAATMQPESA